MKKITTILTVVCVLCIKVFAYSFSDLAAIAMENNSDIKSALNTYESYLLSVEHLNGAYSPSLTVSSYLDGSGGMLTDVSPESKQLGLSYTQPLPGGTTLQVTGVCKVSEIEVADQKFTWGTPSTVISASQSMLPFWVQGEMTDPYKKILHLQQEYYYNHVQYVRNTVLQNVLIQFAMYHLYRNENEIIQNTISVLEEQITAQRELQRNGKSSQVAIIELENSLWKYQQSRFEAITNMQTCFDSIKNLCGMRLTEDEIGSKRESSIDEKFSVNNDPVEEMYRLTIQRIEAERTYEKQNSAPVMTISAQQGWTITSGNEINPNAWEISLGLNFSPWFSAEAKNQKEVYELDHAQAVRNLNEYHKQREFTLQRYAAILLFYQNQLESTNSLLGNAEKELDDYRKLYHAGVISQVDLDSARMNLSNLKLQIDSLHTNIWLYELLITLNDYT